MSEPEALSFGHRLRQLRESAGLTQAELAERADLSVKAIGALESGRRKRPYPSTIRALADAFGLSENERAELAGATPPRSEPPPSPTDAPPDLPVPPAPIIGRERELAEIGHLLGSGTARLITLTGPGGVGKSRLALEVARRRADSPPGRVAFVALASVNDASLVMSSIAQALGLSESGERSAQALLVRHLKKHPAMLVLDNLEHLLAIAPEIASLLAECQELKVVVTSRAPLKIRAEHEYPVRPLALPDLSSVPLRDDVVDVSSVRLFMDRARSANPGFELTQENCAAVATICRRLDGLPLALELVAARVRALSPTELLARLDHVLPMLTGGSRDLPARQQTMSAAIGWSYDLLDPQHQAMFRRLAAFHGGWTIDAAEAVTAWDPVSNSDVIDLLIDLVEQSLVIAETTRDRSTRYRMLEPIREFGSGRVEEAGETESLFDRHLDWCLSLARRAGSEMHGPSQQAWMDRLEEEHDNIRAALAWGHQNPARKARELELAGTLWLFWETRGHLTEGRRWLSSALEASDDAPPELRADALNAAGNLARDQGDHEASTRFHEASLEIRRELGNPDHIAHSLLNLGNVVLDQGQYKRAYELYAEALSLFRQTGNDWDTASSLNNIGIVLGHLGEYEQATAMLEEALQLREPTGESIYRARSLDALGVVMRQKGHLDRAEALHREALALRRELGDTRGIAVTLRNLSLVTRHQGRLAEAGELIEEALRIRRSLEDRLGIAISLGALAAIAHQRGDVERAQGLYCEALQLQHRMGISDGFAESLLGLAGISLDQGEPERAARLLGASDAIRDSIAQAIAPVDRDDYERLVEAIRECLDSSTFELAREAGRTMTGNQVLDEALTAGNQQP